MEVFVNEGVPHTLNQKGRSSMISLLPERCVETVEQYEEQIPAIACTYQAGALVRRTESWKLSSEFRLEAITGVTAQHSRGLFGAADLRPQVKVRKDERVVNGGTHHFGCNK